MNILIIIVNGKKITRDNRQKKNKLQTLPGRHKESPHLYQQEEAILTNFLIWNGGWEESPSSWGLNYSLTIWFLYVLILLIINYPMFSIPNFEYPRILLISVSHRLVLPSTQKVLQLFICDLGSTQSQFSQHRFKFEE